jgi:hypothetical protein
VTGAGSDTLILGGASWNPTGDTSIKYAWRDKREHISRGGEMPVSALRQAVRFAAKESYLSTQDVAGIAHDMIDVLVSGSDAEDG